LHTEIHRLAAHGVGQREMAIHLGMSRELIRRYSRSAAPPKRRTEQRKSKGFGEFEAYMLKRWAQENRNAMLLWREIRAKEFVVAKHRIAFWMRQQIAQEREGLEPLQTESLGKPVLPTASRQLVWLMLKEPDVLEIDELTHVNLIVQASPVMKAAREFALEFQRCVRARDVKKLEAWFETVAVSGIATLLWFFAAFGASFTNLRSDDGCLSQTHSFHFSPPESRT
jgi:transcriptional regulator with XRE-family HTH domain